MPLDLQSTLKRISKARSNKTLWEDHLRECYRYTLPEKQTFDEFSRGQKKHQYVFDSTPVVAVAKYANRMQSQLVPPWQKWMKLEAGSDIPKDKKDAVNEYLEEATDILFNHLNHSNFNSQIHETFLDLAISTGCILVEEGDGIKSFLNFRSVSLSDILVEDSIKGMIDNVWRDLKLPIKDILKIWPKAKLPDNMAEVMRRDPTSEVVLVEGVSYNDNTQDYTMMVISEKHKAVLYEETMTTNPYIVFRESVISGEVIGRGRVMTVLNDIKTLNQVVSYNLDNAALAVSNTYTAVDDSIINPHTIVIAPNSIIPVGSNDSANPTLKPLPRSGDFNLSQIVIQELRGSIKEYLYSEPFGKIDETPVRSATEMGIRDRDMQQSSSSSFSKLQTELLDRLITRSIDILKKAGKIAPFKVDGKEVTIKFTSPSAKINDFADLERVGQMGQYLQMLPPEVVQQEINFGNVTTYIREKIGLPANFQYSDDEKDELAEQRQQQAQAMQEQEDRKVDIEQQKADNVS